MPSNRMRLVQAFLAYPVWIAITVGGAALFQPQRQDLLQSVGAGPAPQFIAALLFLLLVARLAGWHDLALRPPAAPRQWRLLALPSLFLLLFFGLAFALGGPLAPVLFWAGFNTLMVGISEELMFRGVLFRALLHVLSLRWAIVITTLLFGAVHALNVLVTGDLQLALLQSVTAGMSGLLFIALVVRTGSLLPAIVYHWLWDFGAFALLGAGQPATQASPAPSPWLYAVPTLLVLPNCLYALYLLRHVGRTTALRSASEAEDRLS